MIVTEHLFAIEDQTECLISALLESDAVQNYKETKKAMYASTEVAQLQKAFLEAKSAFERVEAYGIHAPDFREKQRNPFFERGKKHSGCGGSCHAS